MKKWIFLLIVILLGIFQVTILDCFKVVGIKPDLLLISIVIASLTFHFRWVLILSVFAGILKDAFSINTFGLNTLLFPLWSFLIIKLSKKISIDNNFIRAAVVFVIVIFNDIIIKLIFLFLGNLVPVGIFLRIIFIESLYTALICPLVFKVIKCV